MIRIFHHYVSKMGFMLLLMELLILLTVAAAPSVTWLGRRQHDSPYLSALAFALVLVFSMSTLGMYQNNSREDIKHTLLRILPSFALGFGLLSMLIGVAPAIQFGPSALVVFMLGALGVLLIRLAVLASSRSSMLMERVILVGDGATASDCLALAADRAGLHQFEVVGCVPVAGEPSRVAAQALLPADQSLLALARSHGATEIVITVGDRRNGAFPVRQLLECALGGLRITDAATFFEREACQIRIDSLQPSFLIFGGGFDQSFLRAAVKRGFDLTASAAICLVTLPLMLLTAALIVAEDGGPVFYQQQRVGKNGRNFNVLKFRSMGQDAERDGQPRWASTDDPRVTRVGYWIRKLRIDELPQMLNVFKGEMSFVGPRPERGYFVEQLCGEVAYYNVRHTIKPGITGLAQVRYRYGASVNDAVQKLQYDLYYVKNNSLFLDLLILIDTVQVVLFGKGSR
ncbi:TIGR03013 family XrtA/PEP-CTERM system glycosyltransferase [Rugamonas apoptosis]|uniref:TIGR03013 family PEP-CTERM/XrtA system glycosyltransferase n=1 Tax=Rugamonas apoptosis TaxID=2758570 RepID=A0A7W2F934_9BURK|nr:TIGR03013 family XrtA/PEP-CTERM system glycosyltransferase [Rugamonas apoptosis]MBA5687299.1 TIGR03013 family PEP-CTERM/XrtA system glycosyltransferase [Rugamonas apoptosis]